MKLEKIASGTKKVTISKAEWLHIGKQAGWDKSAQHQTELPLFNDEEKKKNAKEFMISLKKLMTKHMISKELLATILASPYAEYL